MARSCITPLKKNRQKRRNPPNLYDVYAIYCNHDRDRVNDLLKTLGYLGLKVHCKDYATPGDNVIDANIKNGILASKCSLLFVSSNFKTDHLCKYFTRMSLLHHTRTNSRHRIIPIYLDQTKIIELGIFQEISIRRFSSGTTKNVIPDDRLLCIILKAMKGPRRKNFHHNLRRFHRNHMSYTFKLQKRKKLLKKVKKSKFLRYKFSCDLYSKVVNFGYVVCKCIFSTSLWRKLVELVNHRQVVSIIQYDIPLNIEYLLEPFSKFLILDEPGIGQSRCRYCKHPVLPSELDQHEIKCQTVYACENCSSYISFAKKFQHEQECIYEECDICKDFHSPSHDCPEICPITTVPLEELNRRDNFSRLNSVVSPKFMGQPEVVKALDQLLELVSNNLSSKKTKNHIDSRLSEMKELINQLLRELHKQEIIDEQCMDTIHKSMSKGVVTSIEYSDKSINFFRNFVYAVELNCDISLFKNQSLVKQLMSAADHPQQKTCFLDRFKKKKSPQNHSTDSKTVYPILCKDLFKI